jgi:peptide/nickel transport system substrate-binding protein
MHYDYPEIDELFSQGRKETDKAKRKEIYTELQKKLQDTACFYPLYSNKRLLVVSDKITGIDEAKLVPVYTFEDTSKLKLK